MNYPAASSGVSSGISYFSWQATRYLDPSSAFGVINSITTVEILYKLLSAITILLFVNIFLTLRTSKKEESNELTEIKNAVASLIQNLKDTERNLKEEFATNRKESADTSKGLRGEVTNRLNTFTKTFSDQLTALTSSIGEKKNEEETHRMK